MTANGLIGWIAASLVFAAFCAKRMVPLRALAIVSNIAFIGYGYLDALWPIVILHAVMLPMNVIRLRQALAVENVNEGTGATARASLIPVPSLLQGRVEGRPAGAAEDMW
jgi:hypothetical protein